MDLFETIKHLQFREGELALPLTVVVGAILVLGAVFGARKRPWLVTLLSFVLRALGVGIALFWILGPSTQVTRKEPGTALVAVDLSRSVNPEARESTLSRLAIKAAQEGDPQPKLAMVGFGDRLRAISLPLSDEGSDLQSNLAPALSALLLSPAAYGGSGRLLVISDGATPLPQSQYRGTHSLLPKMIVPSLPAGDPKGAEAATFMQLQAVRIKQAPTEELPGSLELQGEMLGAVARTAVVLTYVDGRKRRASELTFEPGPFKVPLPLPQLSSGWHSVAVAVEALDRAKGELTAPSATVATSVLVERAPQVVVVSDAEHSHLERALHAQEIKAKLMPSAVWLDLIRAGGEAAIAADVIVLDRVSVDALSTQGVAVKLREFTERGGGLVFFPRENRGELFRRPAGPFLDFMPLVGLRPKPKPKPIDKKPKPPEKKPEGLKPPDPNAKKKELRDAPSLGLLLVIDASASMRDEGKLRLAKEAAIAAAEVLHPKDFVGVVHFNTRADVVLEMTEASDQSFIADRISRIQAEGGTNFGPALKLAQEIMEGESLAIRHVIMLSDGRSRPSLLRPILEEMTAQGITVSTVGCGRTFDESLLSDMAVWGKGKFQPAFSATEIPQIFTVEAERVIKASGARSRKDTAKPKKKDQFKPKPPIAKKAPKSNKDEVEAEPEPKKAIPFRIGLEAPYVSGIKTTLIPGVLGHHQVRAAPESWVSLKTEEGHPLLAHTMLGYGRVLSAALPFDGPWALHLLGWDDYSPLFAQIVRFARPELSHRFELQAKAQGRVVRVRVFDRFPSEGDAPLSLKLESSTGAAVQAVIESVGQNEFELRLPPDEPSRSLLISVASPQATNRPALARVDLPPELRSRGPDLLGLESWSKALDGEVLTALPTEVLVPALSTTTRVPWRTTWLPWLLLLLFLDLVVKRWWPGRCG